MNFPSYLSTFQTLTLGAIKADFLRLLLLKVYGGIWTDYENYYSDLEREWLEQHENVLVMTKGIWPGWATDYPHLARLDWNISFPPSTRKTKLIYNAFMKIAKGSPLLDIWIKNSVDMIQRDNWTHCYEIAGPMRLYWDLVRNVENYTFPIDEKRMHYYEDEGIFICEEIKTRRNENCWFVLCEEDGPVIGRIANLTRGEHGGNTSAKEWSVCGNQRKEMVREIGPDWINATTPEKPVPELSC